MHSLVGRSQQKVMQYKHAVGVLMEEKAELVLKVNELETRLSTLQVGARQHAAAAPSGTRHGSPGRKPRAVLEILSDMQAIKQKQRAYLNK